ncbi:hypothetical protein HPB51_015256 [Rhipicephalus microplus]|uniref:Uncharacterized protein n=1 Tax=Rhipicephalus microplus TaxID=6941 RepID=A0A9J6DNT4_RHIMP|nr:hypothetical protein HPB51_015256 [Rhipicephalus microplus]
MADEETLAALQQQVQLLQEQLQAQQQVIQNYEQQLREQQQRNENEALSSDDRAPPNLGHAPQNFAPAVPATSGASIAAAATNTNCVTWPDEELQLLKSGSRSFRCNLCDLSHASGKPNEDDSVACSDDHCSSQTGSLSTCAPPGGDLTGLRRLLLDALEGISFLSDEVSQLREENERLRKDHSRGVEQQARVVASLRAEVCFLREELTRRMAAVAVTAPVIPPEHVNDL